MKKVKDLTVSVTYRVQLGNVEMPKKTYNQIFEAAKNGDEIEPNLPHYSDAAEWLSCNIREKDCMDWCVEIEDIS